MTLLVLLLHCAMIDMFCRQDMLICSRKKKESHLESLNTSTEQPKLQGHGKAGQTSERSISSTCRGFGGSSNSQGGDAVSSAVGESDEVETVAV